MDQDSLSHSPKPSLHHPSKAHSRNASCRVYEVRFASLWCSVFSNSKQKRRVVNNSSKNRKLVSQYFLKVCRRKRWQCLNLNNRNLERKEEFKSNPICTKRAMPYVTSTIPPTHTHHLQKVQCANDQARDEPNRAQKG